LDKQLLFKDTRAALVCVSVRACVCEAGLPLLASPAPLYPGKWLL
jgi:hypothetical protein